MVLILQSRISIKTIQITQGKNIYCMFISCIKLNYVTISWTFSIYCNSNRGMPDVLDRVWLSVAEQG